MRHILKIWPEYYEKIITGEKTFEVRINDRSFSVGDILVLQEWSPERWKEKDGYSGQQVEKEVVYIMNGGQFGIPIDICIMGIQSPISEGELEIHAIRFATWVENNGYIRFDKYYWTNDECETRLSDQQLYHKFQTSN